MPKHAVQAGGEAVPTEGVLTRLMGMLEAGDVQGALSLLSDPRSVQASRLEGTINPSNDPLLDAIEAYWAGLRDFNQNAPEDDNGANAYSDISYGPPLAVLDHWEQPATTLEGALTALKITLLDQNGVYGCAAAEKMVRAAIGYLEGVAGQSGSTAIAKPPVEADGEHPATKVRRLGAEISNALDELENGNTVAYILPARFKTTFAYSQLSVVLDYDAGITDLQTIS